MNRRQLFLSTAKAALATALGALAPSRWASAQEAKNARPADVPQLTGVVGSPGATTTLHGNQIPPPHAKFGGVIKERASESTPWWAPRVVPPKGAPNVLLIMTDDVGFGAPSDLWRRHPYARRWIASPTAGLRYTNFHSTSLCSPTRAAMITGRNHHVGRLRGRGEIGTGYPGYDSIIPSRQRHHRHDPEGERVRHLVVRQGPQHALLSGEPGRAVRPMAHRHGLRLFLRLRRRRRQPMATEPVPQHDRDLSLSGQSRLESRRPPWPTRRSST